MIRVQTHSKKSIKISPSLETDVDKGVLCGMCQKISKYCCPSCFFPFCSLECYKRHSHDCLEAFYRQRVNSVLSFEGKDNNGNLSPSLACKESQGMLENASEKHEANLDESFDDIDESDDTLRQIAQYLHENEFNTTLLSSEQRSFLDKQLLKASRQLRLSSSFSRHESDSKDDNSSWKPWWEGGGLPYIVQAFHISDDVIESLPHRWFHLAGHFIHGMKASIESLYHTSSVSKRLSSPTIKYHILSVLLAYVSIVRMYVDEVKNGVHSVIQVSCLCDRSYRPSSVHDVIETFVRNSAYIPGFQSMNPSRVKLLLKDVLDLLAVENYSTMALLDTWIMILSPSSTSSHLEFKKFVKMYMMNIFLSSKTSKEVPDLAGRKVFFFLLQVLFEEVLSRESLLSSDIIKYINDYLLSQQI